MSKRQTAARSERQLLAHAVVLHERLRHAIRLHPRTQGGIADRQPADPAGGQQVSLEQPGGERQRIRDVVEAEGLIVGRQQRPGVNLHRQQIADGIGVLDPIQPMQGRPSRIRPSGCHAIEAVLQPRSERVVGFGRRPRPRGRRHLAGPQLLDDPLPHRRICGEVVDVDVVEGQVGGAEACVMAGDAVAIEDGAIGGGGGRLDSGRRCGRPRRPGRLGCTRGLRRAHQAGGRDRADDDMLPDPAARVHLSHIAHRTSRPWDPGGSGIAPREHTVRLEPAAASRPRYIPGATQREPPSAGHRPRAENGHGPGSRTPARRSASTRREAVRAATRRSRRRSLPCGPPPAPASPAAGCSWACPSCGAGRGRP